MRNAGLFTVSVTVIGWLTRRGVATNILHSRAATLRPSQSLGINHVQLVQTHLEYGHSAWSPVYKEYALVENIQHMAAKLVPLLNGFTIRRKDVETQTI